jgi:hypothetical protein
MTHAHWLSNGYWEEKQALYSALILNSARSVRKEMHGALQRKGWKIKFCLL